VAISLCFNSSNPISPENDIVNSYVGGEFAHINTVNL